MKDNKENSFIKPELEIVLFTNDDVICDSEVIVTIYDENELP